MAPSLAMARRVSANGQVVHFGRPNRCVVSDCLMLLAICNTVLCIILCFTVYKLIAQCGFAK